MYISANGLAVSLAASVSGITGVLTDFADDADGFDSPSTAIAESAMGLNGNHVFWKTANPIPVNLSVIPNSPSDRLLSTLYHLNRVGDGKDAVSDIITLTFEYPAIADAIPIVCSQGIIVSGTPLNSAASGKRIKTKVYNFMFGNVVGV